MSELKLTSSRHPKTGKSFIESINLVISYKGAPVDILLEQNRVVVLIDGDYTGKTFERSVPLIQILYHIQQWIEAQAV